MTRVCANPACESPPSPSGSSRCGACSSYRANTGVERPARLVRWPGVGHPCATTSEVCRLTGLSYRQVSYLVRTGRACPTVRAAGSGSVHGWLPSDVAGLVEAHVAAHAVGGWPGVSVAVDRDVLLGWLVERWPEGKPVEFVGGGT